MSDQLQVGDEINAPRNSPRATTPRGTQREEADLKRDNVDDFLVEVVASHKPNQKSDRLELNIKKGDMIVVLCLDDGKGWMKGKKNNKDIGWFPRSCVKEPKVYLYIYIDI